MIGYRTCPGCRRLFPLGQYADEASCPTCQAIWRRDHRARLLQRRKKFEQWVNLETNDQQLDQAARLVELAEQIAREQQKKKNDTEEEKALGSRVQSHPMEHWKYLTPRQREALKKGWG